MGPKKRGFKKYLFRGFELEELVEMKTEDILKLFTCRIRRKIRRGLNHNALTLIKKIRKAKLASSKCDNNENPSAIKTHLRDMVIVPEIAGSLLGIYNGKAFNGVELKAEMIGMYLGEFSTSYAPVGHGLLSRNHLSKYVILK